MTKIHKVGIISIMHEYAAYAAGTIQLVGYFDQITGAIVDYAETKIVLYKNEFEVVSIDESAWD